MSEIEIPTYSSRVERDFFSRDSKIVALDLLGRVLTVQHPNKVYHARIHEVAAYEGKTKTTARTASYYPGILGVSQKYGNNLIDISTGKLKQPSCITLISALIENGEGSRFVAGPGNLSDALGIDSKYDGIIVSASPQLWIGGESADADSISVRKRSSAPSNCKGYFYLKES